MSDFKDKTETFKFRPVKEQKPQVNRRENDEYSAARRSNAYLNEEEKGSRALVYVAVILSVLLVGVIVAGIFILKPQKEEEINIPEEENVVIIDDEEEKEEEKNLTLSCSIVFYSDSVIKRAGIYTVLADLYDKDFYKFDNRKLVIDDATEIREDGKRLSPEALIYIIENMGGEGIVFEGEIDENDGTVIKISFDGSFREEIEEEPTEGVEMPDEVNPDEEVYTDDNPVEENNSEKTTADEHPSQENPAETLEEEEKIE